MFILIATLVGLIILLQVFKSRCRRRGRDFERQAQEARWDEQQRTRDTVLLAGIIYAINKGKK